MNPLAFMQRLMQTPEQAGGLPVNAPIPGGSAPVGADAYRQLLEERMARYHGDRDQAVRSANIAGGFGNSTAQRFMHEQAAAAPPPPAAAMADPMQTAAIPTPRPTAFPPDLAVSPPHPADPMAAGAPTNGGAYRPQMPPPLMGVPEELRRPPAPPMPPPLPTDLAVSPTRPDNRPGPKMKARKRGRSSQYKLEPDPARFAR